MAWPQQPQPQSAPQAGGGATLSIPRLIVAISGLLTFLFSFVRIYTVQDADGDRLGESVWSTKLFPGLFGVGTWIPLFALAAGAIALVRSLVKGVDDKQLFGFSLLQLQLVSLGFTVLLWLGYLVGISAAGGEIGASVDIEYGMGMLLLFVGLAGVAVGTAMDVMGITSSLTTLDARKAAGPSAGHAPAPSQGGQAQWQQPAAPQPAQWEQPAAQADPGQWQQPAAPQADPGQWPQQPTAQPDPGQWQQSSPAPGQWQPDPAAPPPGAAPSDPQPWNPPEPAPAPPQPMPGPGPLDPQPAPPQPMPGPAPAGEGGGGLIDSGTQVIPGPPPAPPEPEAEAPGDGGGFPQPPPSNTP